MTELPKESLQNKTYKGVPLQRDKGLKVAYKPYEPISEEIKEILDTHLGSGSSRIAAFYAGLDFVGCEIDKWYFEEQEKRFKERTAQMGLFE